METAADPLLARTRLARRPSRARVLEALTEAHERALAAYVPRPYAGRVVVMRASQQPWGIVAEPAMGWDRLIDDGLEVYEIPGQHKNVLKEPRVKLVAERLRACLQSARLTATTVQPKRFPHN
jgi:thioesterase domain-containing protein